MRDWGQILAPNSIIDARSFIIATLISKSYVDIVSEYIGSNIYVDDEVIKSPAKTEALKLLTDSGWIKVEKSGEKLRYLIGNTVSINKNRYLFEEYLSSEKVVITAKNKIQDDADFGAFYSDLKKVIKDYEALCKLSHKEQFGIRTHNWLDRTVKEVYSKNVIEPYQLFKYFSLISAMYSQYTVVKESPDATEAGQAKNLIKFFDAKFLLKAVPFFIFNLENLKKRNTPIPTIGLMLAMRNEWLNLYNKKQPKPKVKSEDEIY